MDKVSSAVYSWLDLEQTGKALSPFLKMYAHMQHFKKSEESEVFGDRLNRLSAWIDLLRKWGTCRLWLTANDTTTELRFQLKDTEEDTAKETSLRVSDHAYRE